MNIELRTSPFRQKTFLRSIILIKGISTTIATIGVITNPNSLYIRKEAINMADPTMGWLSRTITMNMVIKNNMYMAH